MKALSPVRVTNARESHDLTSPDIGTLSEQEPEEVFRRRNLLGELVDLERVSNNALAQVSSLGGRGAISKS